MQLNSKQILSIVLSVIVYTYLVNYNFAFAFVLAVGFHEVGHLWIAKKLGYQTGGLYIWPFIGGTAFVTDHYKSYNHKVIVALMGPFWGALLATVTTVIGYYSVSPLIISIGFWMSIMNIFNLLPLGFLDGGQVLESYAYSINKKLGIVAYIVSSILAFIFLINLNPFLAFVFIVLGWGAVINKCNDWNNPHLPHTRLTIKQGLLNGLFYLVIVAILYFNLLLALKVQSLNQMNHALFGG